MSVSRIRDSDAARFSAATDRLLMVCSKRFCRAPSVARSDETVVIASSIRLIALLASFTRVRPPRLSAEVLTQPTATENASHALAPSWNVPLPPPDRQGVV